MKKRLLKFALLSVLIAAAGSAADVQAQTVTGSIGNGTVTRGKTVKGTVVLNIPGGLHVNSSRPDSQYAVPTTVRVSANGVKVGSITYPRGKNRRFAFSEVPINVYDGLTSFGFKVTVPADFKGRSVSVRVAVKYQACTDEVCYRPTTKQITLTAKVK